MSEPLVRYQLIQSRVPYPDVYTYSFQALGIEPCCKRFKEALDDFCKTAIGTHKIRYLQGYLYHTLEQEIYDLEEDVKDYRTTIKLARECPFCNEKVKYEGEFIPTKKNAKLLPSRQLRSQMVIKVTRWYLDTCQCVFDYAWDDESSEATRVHTLVAVVNNDGTHGLLTGVPLYKAVLAENVKRQVVVTI